MVLCRVSGREVDGELQKTDQEERWREVGLIRLEPPPPPPVQIKELVCGFSKRRMKERDDYAGG